MQYQYYRVIIYVGSNDPQCPLQQIDQLFNVSEPDILDILNTSYPQFQVSQVHRADPFPVHSENIDPNPNYCDPDFQYCRRRSTINPSEVQRFEPDFSSFGREEIHLPRYSNVRKIPMPQSDRKKTFETISQPSYQNPYEDDQRAYRSVTCLRERPSPQNLGLMEQALLDRRGSTRTRDSNHGLTRTECQEQNCLICLEAIDEKPKIALRNCSDVFHFACLEQQLQIKIDKRSFPIHCPLCPKDLDVEDIKNALQTNLQYQRKFEKYSLQAYLNTHLEELDLCQTPDCDYAYGKNPSQMRFDCPKCQRVYCKNCKANWTNGHSCGKLKEIQDYYANENRTQQSSNYYNNVP